MREIEVNNLNVFYGGIQALHDVSMHVDQGEIVSIIGANGAGKSTFMRSVAGDQKYEGEILYRGAPLPKDSYQVVKTGITLVPEGRRIFPGLTVKENLMIGAYTRKDKKQILEDMEEIFQLFPRLKERINQTGGSMSGGEQQMLAVSRALISNPKVLMLDEPSLGLAPIVVDELFDKIVDINRKKNLTIILVEQNANLAMDVADRVYVLKTGSIVMEGTGKEMQNNSAVVESFLGQKK